MKFYSFKNPIFRTFAVFRYYLVVVICFGYSFNLSAQATLSQKEITAFYTNQGGSNPLHFLNTSSLGWDQIILVRHGEPDVKKKGWHTRKEAIEFMRAYDSVGIRPFPSLPFEPKSIIADTIWHSSIPRAAATAEVLFGGERALYPDFQFREFERKALRFFNIKLPLKFWTVFSRIGWFMGGNDKGIESFKEAKKRAKQNAGWLAQKSKMKGNVVLVAHGLHNRYVAKYLEKQGWEMVLSNGHDYGSVKILVRRSE